MTIKTALGLEPIRSLEETARLTGLTKRQVIESEDSAFDKLFFILALRWGWIPLDWEPEMNQ